MIIEGIFKLLLGLIKLLLGLIPQISFDIDFPDMTFFKDSLGMADYFFPIGTLISAIGIVILVQNSKFILKIFTFILKRIPFIG